jgi:hypothetical protein
VRHPLLLGKLGRQGRLNAVVPGSLDHIVDQLSNRCFLIGTGASFSIFPHNSSASPSGPNLRGTAGQLILCWGEKTLTLLLHGRHFTWSFLLAVVSFPIIGVDFLRHFQLMVDPAANMLVDKASLQSFVTVSLLTAAFSSLPASAVNPAALPTVTGQQSLVINHRCSPSSSPSGPASAVPDVKVPTGLSAAALSAGIGSSPLQLQLAVLKNCWQNFLQ